VDAELDVDDAGLSPLFDLASLSLESLFDSADGDFAPPSLFDSPLL
jgi:hypothetical protein